MIEKIQKDMLLLLGNEETQMPHKSRYGFTYIITQLDRIQMGIRYHEYKGDCPCQPETKIKEIINEDGDLKEFLETHDNLLERLYKIIYIDEYIANKDKTVFDVPSYDTIEEVERIVREERGQ